MPYKSPGRPQGDRVEKTYKACSARHQGDRVEKTVPMGGEQLRVLVETLGKNVGVVDLGVNVFNFAVTILRRFLDEDCASSKVERGLERGRSTRNENNRVVITTYLRSIMLWHSKLTGELSESEDGSDTSAHRDQLLVRRGKSREARLACNCLNC